MLNRSAPRPTPHAATETVALNVVVPGCALDIRETAHLYLVVPIRKPLAGAEAPFELF